MIWKFKNKKLHFFLNPVIFLDRWERFEKSTFLSLILGEPLLLDSFLTTSSITCELRYGKTPRLVAHYKDADPETGLFSKTIQLSEMAVNSQDLQGSVFDKIEIISPNSLLKVVD